MKISGHSIFKLVSLHVWVSGVHFDSAKENQVRFSTSLMWKFLHCFIGKVFYAGSICKISMMKIFGIKYEQCKYCTNFGSHVSVAYFCLGLWQLGCVKEPLDFSALLSYLVRSRWKWELRGCFHSYIYWLFLEPLLDFMKCRPSSWKTGSLRWFQEGK